jgi:putative solute:sodium symporter small subunit
MTQDSIDPAPDKQAAYWRRTRRLTVQLLLVWFAVTFGVIFFARDLAEFTLFGWPVSFYMAAQGAVLIYVAIIAMYAWRMRQFDKTYTDDASNDE